MLDKLIKIEKLLNEAQEIYEELPQEEQDKILKFHNDGYTLPYCLRWGNQAIEEINDDILQRLSNGEIIKYGKHQMYYDKMCGEYVIEKFEYLDDGTTTKQPMYSVVNGFESFDEALKCILKLR